MLARGIAAPLDQTDMGFLIQDDDGKPKLALCYKTQKEADDAAAHADQMLANTIFLSGIGDETHSS